MGNVKATTDRYRRILQVNEIIGMIATRGRRFFLHKGKTAGMVFSGGFLYWINEWDRSRVNLNRGNWGDWSIRHGGTLRTVIQCFRDFVMRGTVIKNDHLFTNWGYDPEEMEEIKSALRERGMLAEKETV
jgi:hypothetical protein